MKPIEAMAKAIWDYANDGGWDLRPHDGPSNSEREHYRAKARAALLGLAESPLSQSTLGAGRVGVDIGTFRAILRTIAEDQP